MSSRPMAVQNTPFNGTLWFLTRSTSEKIGEVQQDDRVTLTFAEPKGIEVRLPQGTGASESGSRQNKRALESAV